MSGWDGIACTVSQGSIVASFPDGSRAAIPAHLVSKSRTLQDLMSAAASADEFSLMAPAAWLQCWLQHASAEDTAVEASALDTPTAITYLMVCL